MVKHETRSSIFSIGIAQTQAYIEFFFRIHHGLIFKILEMMSMVDVWLGRRNASELLLLKR